MNNIFNDNYAIKVYFHHPYFQIEDSVKEKALKKGVLVLQRKGELVESFFTFIKKLDK